ncbi:MAG: hypothetical protein WBM93_08970 [Parasphingorhabdus sp.]
MASEQTSFRNSVSNPGATGSGSHAPERKTEGRGRTSPAPFSRAFPVLTVLMIAMLSTPAFAAQGQRKKGVIGNAGDAVTQPLNDLNLRSDDIPVELLAIQDEPYSLDRLQDCSALRREITKLEDVLGPDVDAPQKQSGLVSKALKSGGSFLGGFIPFRGAVRELSGANAARRRMESAVYAGVARRGFLKGYAAAQQCKTSEELAIEAAEIRLGLRTVAIEPEITELQEPPMTLPILPTESILEVDLPPSDIIGLPETDPGN